MRNEVDGESRLQLKRCKTAHNVAKQAYALALLGHNVSHDPNGIEQKNICYFNQPQTHLMCITIIAMQAKNNFCHSLVKSDA